jgi:ubiquinone/menaquinone biosynthesis C-methylase UbiE
VVGLDRLVESSSSTATMVRSRFNYPKGLCVTNTDPNVLDVNIRSGPQMLEYEHIADRIAAAQMGPVLDWGCGWGQVTSLLKERGVQVECFDYRDGEDVHVTQLERFPQISVRVSGDPVKLPFSDSHFGAVLSCGVLEHVQDPDASLVELHRVLQPGGCLFIYKLPNRVSYLEFVARLLGRYYHGKLPHDRVYDRRRVSDLLSQHGFRIDMFRRTNMLPLTLSNGFAWRYASQIWRLNRWLGRIPLGNLLATNLEVEATAIELAPDIGDRSVTVEAQIPTRSLM